MFSLFLIGMTLMFAFPAASYFGIALTWFWFVPVWYFFYLSSRVHSWTAGCLYQLKDQNLPRNRRLDVPSKKD